MVRGLVEARNDMLAPVQAAVTDAKQALGLDVAVGAVYTMTDKDGTPDNAAKAPWIRAKIMHTAGGKASISGRRREHSGNLRVSVYWPSNKSNAAHNCQRLADFIETKLSQHRGFVMFRNIRFDDVDPEGAFARQDILTDFTWEQLAGA